MRVRAALSSAVNAGSRGGELAVEALRLRVRAKRLRAEADLADAQLAQDKVRHTSHNTHQDMWGMKEGRDKCQSARLNRAHRKRRDVLALKIKNQDMSTRQGT